MDDDRDVVEKCHEVMKSYVKVRPVLHWVPRRVRAHIYLCILGYFLRAEDGTRGRGDVREGGVDASKIGHDR